MYARTGPLPSLPVMDPSSSPNLTYHMNPGRGQERVTDLLKTSALYSVDRERRVEP